VIITILEVPMFYSKNVPAWERIARVGAGIIMLSCGVVWMNRSAPLAYLFIASGVLSALTGFVGFCPMCALAGRRLKD
jgi:hypothetical protein